MAQTRMTMSGQRRIGSKLTPQENDIIEVSFKSFSEEADITGATSAKRYINADKLKEAFVDIHAKAGMQDIQLLLDDIDESGGGRIDEAMWRNIMTRKFLGEEDDSSAGHVFSMLDDNKDGFIPLVEFRRMLMQEGQEPLSEQEVDELLMFADADADGLIDYRSFLLWLSNPGAYHKDVEDTAHAMAAKPSGAVPMSGGVIGTSQAKASGAAGIGHLGGGHTLAGGPLGGPSSAPVSGHPGHVQHGAAAPPPSNNPPQAKGGPPPGQNGPAPGGKALPPGSKALPPGSKAVPPGGKAVPPSKAPTPTNKAGAQPPPYNQ